MSRRQFLKAGAALAASALPLAGKLGAATPAAPAAPLKRLGTAEPFDYAQLKGLARSMSAAVYKPPSVVLPPPIAKLSWDQWQAIRFRDNHSLWAGEGVWYQARFFHLGFTVTKPVRLYSVESGHAQELAYDAAMFDYSRSGVDAHKLAPNLGFAGFRLLFHSDWTRDVAAFQGASYFRAVDGDKQYGMSQRGLAIDCGMGRPEEFPDFIAYYLERPARNSSQVTVYGLLDSASVAGAYRFVIDVADTIVMDIDAALYPRKSIERLGIAPGTSMFLDGPNDRRVDNDWRPAIHDSDGLQINNGSAEWLWRPLVNPSRLLVTSFSAHELKGFGLMQRDRNFLSYEDTEARYDQRPSVWITPKGSWGPGRVELVQIPTPDETNDNIVAYWVPDHQPAPGEALDYAYRMHWQGDKQQHPPSGWAVQSRRGHGFTPAGIARDPSEVQYVIDFDGPSLRALAHNAKVNPMVTAGVNAIITDQNAFYNDVTGAWRMTLRVNRLQPLQPVELRAYLRSGDNALTETWTAIIPPD